MKLKIASDLALPLDLVTEPVAIVARRGRGKTYAGSVMAEELLKAGQQVAIFDPLDVWWGLRSSADAQGEGFPVVIFGGDHADVPITPAMGKQVADFIVSEDVSCIVVPDFETNQDTVEFMTALLDRLLKQNREPLHLFFDEAEGFAPERPAKYEARMLGAMGRLVKRGRVRGLGATLITQRTASLNKNVLTQVGGLFVMAISSPWDRAPVELWMKSNGTAEQIDDLKEDLASLPRGEGYFWHPEWNIFKRILIRHRETFDSSATPEPGQKVKAPKKRADIDIGAVARRMQEAVERAKQEDPAELRKEITRLKRELTTRPKETQTVEVQVPVEVPVPLLDPSEADKVQDVLSRIYNATTELGKLADLFSERLQKVKATPAPVLPARQVAPQRTSRVSAPAVQVEGITKSRKRVLDALAWLEAMSFQSGSRVQVAFLANYKPGTGNFNNLLGGLRSAGMVEYPQEGRVMLTDEGRATAEAPPIPTTVDAFQQAVLAKLKGPQGRVLQQLLTVYPEALTREELAARSGYTPGTGNFNNIVGSLRSLEIVHYPNQGYVAALPVLFLESA